MEICVAGMGIIGGSMCLALKRAGYTVYGWNRSKHALEYAFDHSIIDGTAQSFENFDVVFIALPPEAAVRFINENTFKDGAIVADVCGVKKYIEDAVNEKPRNFQYVGCHPMAGKEVSGIENACEHLFDWASMIVVRGNAEDWAMKIMWGLIKDMGFGRIVECTAEIHDKKIAYTSQLAHIVSNAYVKDGEIAGCIGFTGGSFQDMTRIAGVDENMWASLYVRNAENLKEKLDNLITSLKEVKTALERGDEGWIAEILREGKECYTNGRKNIVTPDIFVQNLK
ncbi:MAG: prephenate dehydrogenase/arogenate dehydrogenase family protein [Clostridia bacterium]|nr:prephenate dehydrogenase/arogenate dehydrogenase family protein [Clostridia bacterium]